MYAFTTPFNAVLLSNYIGLVSATLNYLWWLSGNETTPAHVHDIKFHVNDKGQLMLLSMKTS